MFREGEQALLNKPPHIVEGVIVMPGTRVTITKIHEDGTYDVLFYDREQMPHTIHAVRPEDLSAL
ncbi:MAG: hypothetical protein NZM25_00200 [Leptospiraceae bacterium]|nr:hypothetical protein [Leptospiraceae bacterium]MDW8307538.1 hypothetical protein [Leptospiraceae bacterium]